MNDPPADPGNGTHRSGRRTLPDLLDQVRVISNVHPPGKCVPTLSVESRRDGYDRRRDQAGCSDWRCRTNADVHVAAAVNHVGGCVGRGVVPHHHRRGYRRLVRRLRSFGELAMVGVEGTGSYGVGVARVSAASRHRRGGSGPAQPRHRHGKSDPVDAVAAARAALSGVASGRPKSRDGNVEAIQVLMMARRSAIDARIETLNQVHDTGMTPEDRDEMVELLAREAFDLSGIIDDLLVAARIEIGKLEVTEVSTALRAQLAQVTRELGF